LTSLPSTTFHLDFYASPPPAGSAQARVWLGFKDVTTSAGGSVSFSHTNAPPVPIGFVIKATATDPAGNTSGLSSDVIVSATDTLGDGVPNSWRALWFGGAGTSTNSQSCATCDPDNDGLNNRQEFYAGTNPTNATSTLRLSAPAIYNNTNVLLSFQSVTGIVYRIESRSDLVAEAWSVVADQLVSPGGIMQITEPGVAGFPRFYRLAVLP
jgi:hypothetical protein